MPEDLFRWPEAWKEFRPRESSQPEEETREEREGGSGNDPRA